MTQPPFPVLLSFSCPSQEAVKIEIVDIPKRQPILIIDKERRASMQPQENEKNSALKRFTRDLTALAERGALDPVIGRDKEIRRVIQVLSRRTKNNPVLIGEPGVGKTAIAEGLALRIISQDVPDVLMGKRVLSLDLAALVAGSAYRGEFENRLKSLVKAVEESSGQIILFIDELHTLVGAGKIDGALDAGQILKPSLARGGLRAIGAATTDEYRNYIEKDKALERRFQTVLIEEPSVEDTIAILRGLKKRYEVHHGVRIQDSALKQAACLSHRYIPSRFLPDKAIDLMDEAASHLNIEIGSVPSELDEIRRQIIQLKVEKEALSKEKDRPSKERLKVVENKIRSLEKENKKLSSIWEKEKADILDLKNAKKAIEELKMKIERAEREGFFEKAAELKYSAMPKWQKKLEDLSAPSKKKTLLKEEVSPAEVAEVVSRWTGIPIVRVMEEGAQKLLKMESALKKKVVGQDQALKVISSAVRRSRAGISDPKKPMGVFMFLGPTGVGKTCTAKALAEFLFDSEKKITRIDMSEYVEKHSVYRLIGAPPGYIGFEQGGELTEAVRRRPYSIILLDEIEKAHREVFHILLQVFDEGRLTDGQGRLVDFKNSLIIMTSNVGSESLLKKQNVSKVREETMGLLHKMFRPEFLNRVDDFIFFNSLERPHLKEIVKIHLAEVKERLIEKKVNLHFDSSVVDYLLEKGFDPSFGARPLKRKIESKILNPLAEKLIRNDIKEDETIEVRAHDLGLEFHSQSLPQNKSA